MLDMISAISAMFVTKATLSISDRNKRNWPDISFGEISGNPIPRQIEPSY